MNRFLLSASALAFVVCSAVGAQAQSKTRPAEPNPWFTDEPAVVAPAVAAPTFPAVATEEAAAYRTGWTVAPGMSLSTHQRPTTDYQGRPLKKTKASRKAVAQAVAVEEAPVYNTGWMVAPGMSLSTHQRPTTDYWGRPLKQPVRRKAASSLSAAPAERAPIAVLYQAQQ